MKFVFSCQKAWFFYKRTTYTYSWTNQSTNNLIILGCCTSLMAQNIQQIVVHLRHEVFEKNIKYSVYMCHKWKNYYICSWHCIWFWEPNPSISVDIFPFKLKRKQFRVRLSFAMTINKAQGQTILNLGVYLSVLVFSHGQLYVALSKGILRWRSLHIKRGVSRGFTWWLRHVNSYFILFNLTFIIT